MTQSSHPFSGTPTLRNIISLLLAFIAMPACADAPKHCCDLADIVSQINSDDHAVSVIGVVEQVSSANVILDRHTTPTHYSRVVVRVDPGLSPAGTPEKLTLLSWRATEVLDGNVLVTTSPDSDASDPSFALGDRLFVIAQPIPESSFLIKKQEFQGVYISRYVGFILDAQIDVGTPLFKQTDTFVEAESLLAAANRGERIDAPEFYRRHFAQLPLTIGSALKISSKLME